jgi:hypothetical protein
MKLRISLLIALTLLAGLHQAAAQTTFAPPTNYPVGYGPSSVVATDVNGDGWLDLICVYYGGYSNAVFHPGNTLTLLTNSGNGNFGYNATYTVGGFPESVIAADINGDGKVDLICANSGSNTLSVLTNNGSGGFMLNATLDVGARPSSVVAADVNGDGWLDLISANNDGNTLSVLTNNGNGSLGSNATLNVGSTPVSVTTADVNGDGKVDLVCANNGLYPANGTFSVFTNNGSGGFTLAFSPDEGTSLPNSLVAADLNGDGKADLICVNLRSPTLLVFTNDGSSDFTLVSSAIPSAILAESVTAADVNGDGRLDLISANENANTLSVLFNTSIFPPPTSTPAPTIKPSGNGLLVSWPSDSAGWSLQQNPDLTTTNWSPSGYSGYGISDDGTNKSLVIQPPTGNLFFRLLHP